jgi:hypothetical protein
MILAKSGALDKDVGEELGKQNIDRNVEGGRNAKSSVLRFRVLCGCIGGV